MAQLVRFGVYVRSRIGNQKAVVSLWPKACIQLQAAHQSFQKLVMQVISTI